MPKLPTGKMAWVTCAYVDTLKGPYEKSSKPVIGSGTGGPGHSEAPEDGLHKGLTDKPTLDDRKEEPCISVGSEAGDITPPTVDKEECVVHHVGTTRNESGEKSDSTEKNVHCPRHANDPLTPEKDLEIKKTGPIYNLPLTL